MEKVQERAKKYEISVKLKCNGYYLARITFRLQGGKNERIEKSGTTDESAVLNLLLELEEHLKIAYYNNLITSKIEEIAKIRLIDSINTLNMQTVAIRQKTLEIVNLVDAINSNILNQMYIPNVLPFYNVQQNNMSNNVITSPRVMCNENIISINSNEQHEEQKNYRIDELATDWKEYELQLCIKSDDNPRPLSQKTVDGYLRIFNKTVLPYFYKNKLLYISQVDEEQIKALLKTLNGYDNKRNVYIVLKLLYKYLRKQKDIDIKIMENIDKPIKPAKDKENDIVCIETEDQSKYIEAFEKEDTDMSLLFETMLLTGVRPEEACGLKWCALKYYYENNVKRYELVINNAYKDFIVYDEDRNPIGHERHDDGLKSEESYRTIPLNNKFAERLLQHKERQKQLFKNSRAIKRNCKKWSENEYMFLGRTYNPYVAESLSGVLPDICDKYKLTRITPYVLRHSFATFCYEKGMKELTLMKIMGHSDFNTTHKYYIRVTKKVKQREMEEVFKEVFYDRKAS